VRVSQSQPGHYAISAIQHNNHFDHMLILPSQAHGGDVNAPGNTRYRLGTTTREMFNTVPKLIAYYIDRPYIDVRRLQGTVVPEQAGRGGYEEVNPHAPQWLKGAISRVDAEAFLEGGTPGTFVLRTKLGHGHVLSMVLPAGHPNVYKHHLLTSNGGQFFIDNQGIGQHASVESVIALLQADTLGLIACPLTMAEFDAPEFTAEYGGSMAGDSYIGEAAYDTASGVLEEATYDHAAIGGGGGGGLNTMGSIGSALYDSAAGVMGGDGGGYAEQTTNYGAGYQDVGPDDGDGDDAYGAAAAAAEGNYGESGYTEGGYAEQTVNYGDEATYQDEVSLAAGDPIYDQAPLTGGSMAGGDPAYMDMPAGAMGGDDPAYSDMIGGAMGMVEDLGEALYDQAPLVDDGTPSSSYMTLNANA